MHWLEGLFIIAVGSIPWLIANGTFPKSYQQRKRLETAMPLVKNTFLVQCVAVFIWVFGGAIFANSFFDLGWPL